MTDKDMTGKQLQYDAAIYQKEEFTPEDLKTLHDRADQAFEQSEGQAYIPDPYHGMTDDEFLKSVVDEADRLKEAHPIKPPATPVDVNVEITNNCPIHCSYLPGAPTADFSVPITVFINEFQQRGSISRDITIPEALYLLDQLNAFVHNYILKTLPKTVELDK